ncbi:MAG: hypothetical protein E6G43_12175, partial [Actinobacteria bacterium]
MSESSWELPGSPVRRRAALWGTAARVAARYGIVRVSRPPRARRLARAHERGARDVYRTAIHLRGGFLKFGQFASA